MFRTDIRGDVSFVIAVVGHRDLYDEDRDNIRAEIRKFLEEQKNARAGTRLLVITGMAEGADCLAAEAAGQAGIPYVAVLPFDETAYFDSFDSTAASVAAQELTAGAKARIVLPRTRANRHADFFTDVAARDAQYGALSAFLVEASQILLAIYDSGSEPLMGGAADSILFKLGNKPLPGLSECSGLNNAGVGPVHTIAVRRRKYPRAHPVTPIRAPQYPAFRLGASEDGYKESYRLQDAFNQDVARGAGLKDKVAKSRAELYPGIEGDTNASRAMDWIADRYAWADALAIHNQSVAKRLWDSVFLLLAAGAVAVVSLHVLPKVEHNLALEVCYYVMVLLALALGVFERHRGYRRRHEDYRALAEALRIQYFWLASGIRKLVAEFYLSKQAGEAAWVRDAMSEVVLENAPQAGEAADPEDALFDLGLALLWTEQQGSYFSRSAKRNLRRARRWNVVALGMFLFAVLLQLACTVLYHGLPAGNAVVEAIEHWGPVTRFVITVLIAWAALTKGYADLNNYSSRGRQEESMQNLFLIAAELLKKDDAKKSAAATTHARQVIEELGRAALQESGDWMLMHREKKLDLLMAGS